ncbi:hypothetical protein ACVCK3_04385 [Bacillus cereus]|uniref:hypothetical protein n=1 Tax=Bacillus thuringiensis TaxID=1428 RepID=UPI000BF2EFF3|nr:hypothetical protein [Bacillus thuringiensis]PEQ66182.1 hypothetical protein CN474_26950 [Bacillus thuringiensis]
MSIRHVSNADNEGWLLVKFSGNSNPEALPQYLRVEYIKTEAGRDYFKVIEGVHAGKEGSVKQKEGGGSYLIEGDPKQPAAKVHFVIGSKKLWYQNDGRWIGPIDTMTDPENKVPVGTYDIEIPDAPHKVPDEYKDKSRFAGTWFRIGHIGDRYLHPGSVSAGCATVTDIPIWTDLYNYLINRRKDDKSVGEIYVFATDSDRPQ